MEKIKKIFSLISNSIKGTFKKFPITMVIVYITTLLCAFGTDDFVKEFFEKMWFFTMAVWAIGTIFTETFFKNNIAKILGGSISFIIALACRWIINDELYSNNLILMKLIITYISAIPLITLYKTIKDTGMSVKEYALKVLSNIGKSTTIYLLANIGILIVVLVFVELILDGNNYDILSKSLILLLGIFYVPAIINSITDVTNEVGKFIKILLTFILMPVAMFLISTLYLYVIKIILKGELLNKSLFFILSLTFSLTIPGVILLKNYEENKKVVVISNILLYSFIPLLFLQVLAMNVRVKEYGLTESRYMGYLLIVFEIIFIALIIIKKSKYLDKIILVFTGFVIFGLLSPFNVFDVPVYSQTARITNMLRNVESFDELSINQKNECKKALIYVENSTKPEYLDKKLSKEEKEAIKKYVITYENENIGCDYKYEYISVYNYGKSEINIEGFKKMYLMRNDFYGEEEETDLSNYEITDRNENVKVTVNLQEFIEQMRKANKNNTKESTFENIKYLKTNDENITICITEFSMRYEVYSNKIDHISIDGYILEK